jgi:hypothetical protein
MMRLYDKNEVYMLNDEGMISRACLNGVFSGQWKLLGMARLNNFGNIVERIPFPQCLEIKDWEYKNGSIKWHPIDFDHGSRRIWGRAAKIIN